MNVHYVYTVVQKRRRFERAINTMRIAITLYTVSEKSSTHRTHIDNFVNFQRIFRIFLLAHSAENS